MHQQQSAFENIVLKEEIACYEQLLLFPQYFLLKSFVHIFDIIFSFASKCEKLKIGISGKGLDYKIMCNMLLSDTLFMNLLWTHVIFFF